MILNELLACQPYIDNIKTARRPVLLYGTGNGADKIIAHLAAHDIEIADIAVSDEFFRGNVFNNIPVKPLSYFYDKLHNYTVVSAFALEGERCSIFFDLAKKTKFFAPNLPPYGEGCLDKAFISENMAAFKRIFDKLGDQASRQLFINHLSYCITGDISLQNYANDHAPEQYISHKATHMDIGAYDGDTVLEYAAQNPCYGRIIALEPDPATFERLRRNTLHLRDIECINGAAWSSSGEGSMTAKGSRGSAINPSGEQPTAMYTIDELSHQTTIGSTADNIGSIKIDGEGCEEHIIDGGANTIYIQKPSICAAVYHRYDDILRIPQMLLYHNPDYTLYFRRKKYIPAFDTFIYAI